jgi:hypothetical protein
MGTYNGKSLPGSQKAKETAGRFTTALFYPAASPGFLKIPGYVLRKKQQEKFAGRFPL